MSIGEGYKRNDKKERGIGIVNTIFLPLYNNYGRGFNTGNVYRELIWVIIVMYHKCMQSCPPACPEPDNTRPG